VALGVGRGKHAASVAIECHVATRRARAAVRFTADDHEPHAAVGIVIRRCKRAAAQIVRLAEIASEIRAVHRILDAGITRDLETHQVVRFGNRARIDTAREQNADGIRVRITSHAQEWNFDREVALIAVVGALRAANEFVEERRVEPVRRFDDDRPEIEQPALCEMIFGISKGDEPSRLVRAPGAGLKDRDLTGLFTRDREEKVAAEVLLQA